MKTFKTFMAAISMLMVSGSAMAQSEAPVDYFGKYIADRCGNCMDKGQDCVVGTYEHLYIEKGNGVQNEYLYVYGGGSFVLKTIHDDGSCTYHKGTWQKTGYTYLFQSETLNCQFHSNYAGLNGDGFYNMWIRM